MNSRAEREERKAMLLREIQQQRLNLSASCRDWFTATGSYDRGWIALQSLRTWALVGSSMIALGSIRHPNRLVRWAKRGFSAWSIWRLVKNTLQPPSAR